MNEKKLEKLLTDGIVTGLHLYDEVGSTNDMAREFSRNLITKGDKSWINELFISELQSSGKGRLGRNWNSPAGTGIWMSLATRLKLEGDRMPGVTLLSALCTARVICSAALQMGIQNIDVKIKWPNDIVVNKKKICGILTELVSDPAGGGFVVTGMGINANTTHFPNDIRDKATSLLNESGVEWDREGLVAAIITVFSQYLKRYETEQSLDFILEDYNSLLINIGEEVVIVDDGERSEETYISRGIDNTGALLVEDNTGEVHRIISGEVSVRGILGYV